MGEIINSKFYKLFNVNSLTNLDALAKVTKEGFIDIKAEIELTNKSITQRVESVEQGQTTTNNNVTTLTDRVSKAEEKITDKAIINTVSTTIKQAKDEAIESANTTTDNKLKDYATSAEVTQTAENIKFTFTQSGGYNMLKNGCFLSGAGFWNMWGNPSISINNTDNGYIKALQISTTGSNQGVQQTVDNLQIGKTYTLSAYVKADSGIGTIQIQNNIRYPSIGTTVVNEWQWLTLTFEALATSIKIQLGRNSGGLNGIYNYTAVLLQEGSIKTAWTPNPNEIYNGSTIIDGSGVTVLNGALRVKNTAGTTVLEGDANGNLTLTGTVKSQKGYQYVSLDSGGVTFQDANKKEQLLRMALTSFGANRDFNGVAYMLPRYADFTRFGHIGQDDLTQDWTGTRYNFFDLWSNTVTVDGYTFNKGMTVYCPIYANGTINLKSNGDIPATITGNTGVYSQTGFLGLFGDNGTILGYKSANTVKTRIDVCENSPAGTGDHINSYGNWNLHGYTIHAGTFNGNFVGKSINNYTNEITRTSSEVYAIESELDQVRFNLENIQITNGKAILNLPKKYMGINNGYIISSIVKKGRGDVWVAEEQKNRFVIEAENDIKINIEVIIKISKNKTFKHTSKDPCPIVLLDNN